MVPTIENKTVCCNKGELKNRKEARAVASSYIFNSRPQYIYHAPVKQRGHGSTPGGPGDGVRSSRIIRSLDIEESAVLISEIPC
jgi:hypothetical protein